MAIETYWCPGPWPWQWFRTCTRDVPDPPPDPCKAAACVAAQTKLAEARGRFNSNCTGLKIVNAVIKLLKQVLAVPIWVIVVMAIIAAIIGGPIAIIIWGLIAIYGISWILVFVLGQMAISFADGLAKANLDVANAIKEVVTNCPEQCRGDLSPPICNLD